MGGRDRLPQSGGSAAPRPRVRVSRMRLISLNKLASRTRSSAIRARRLIAFIPTGRPAFAFSPLAIGVHFWYVSLCFSVSASPCYVQVLIWNLTVSTCDIACYESIRLPHIAFSGSLSMDSRTNSFISYAHIEARRETFNLKFAA